VELAGLGLRRCDADIADAAEDVRLNVVVGVVEGRLEAFISLLGELAAAFGSAVALEKPVLTPGMNLVARAMSLSFFASAACKIETKHT
jgi:hypothetical protein